MGEQGIYIVELGYGHNQGIVSFSCRHPHNDSHCLNNHYRKPKQSSSTEMYTLNKRRSSQFAVKSILLNILIFSLLATFHSTIAQVPASYYYEQAIQNYQSGNYSQAIQQFQKTIAIDSSQFQAYVMTCSSFMQMKDWSEVTKYATIGQRKFPNESIFSWQLGEAFLQSKEYIKALKAYQTLDLQANLPPQITKDIVSRRLGECHSQIGSDHANSGNWKSATVHFQKANSYLKDQLFSYTNLTYAYTNQANWSATINIADKGLTRFPANEDLLKVKASALYQLKDYKGAARAYGQLHKKAPNDIITGIAYGELLMASQDYATASTHYNELIRRNPKEKQIYESLIKIYENRLNYQGKIELLQQMLPLFDQPAIYERIAETYVKIEHWSLAKSYYDTLLLIEPANELVIKQQIGRLTMKEGDEAKALDIYQNLHRKFPNDKEVLDQLGRCQENLNLWSAALTTYQQLHDLASSANTFLKLGLVNEQLNHTKEAIMYYQSSLQHGESARALLGLSRLLRNAKPDSSLLLAKQSFNITCSKLEDYESILNQKIEGNGGLNAVIDNEDLIYKINEEEQLASEVFYHLASYPLDMVSDIIDGLAHKFPRSAKVHFFIGEYKYNHDLAVESEKFLRKSLSLDPNQMEAHFLIGKLYEQSSRFHEGILSFERVLSLDHENNKAYHQLIVLYDKTGKLDQLCDKWMIRYKSSADGQVLKPHLIEALHKAGRYDEAKEIIGEKI